MDVEHLRAVLEVGGLSTFAAQMAAADKATGGVKDQLAQVTAVSKSADAALRNVRMDPGQAAQTQAVAETINRAVRGIGTTAVYTSSQLADVKLTGAQTTGTVANAAVISAALRGVDSSAAGARRSIEGMNASSTVAGGGGAISAALLGAAAGGRGGGGGGIGPLLAAAAAGGARGGGGGGGILSALGFGQGMFGMAGFGSVAGLAGFGAERAVTSSLGILGSMGGGLVGGGLLGLGALGTTAVGMGTDLAGIGQAAGDIKNTTQALDQLQTAITTYGKNSQQAAQAQRNVNVVLAGFSPVARQAVLAASQTAQGFHAMFNTMTGEAEKTGAKIIQQAMLVGEKFLPTIGMFASQNMGIIKQGLQPLFTWLQNPGGTGGLGIFTNLEQIFQKNLPTSVHAFSQALEVLFKVVDDAAQHLGGFIAYVDKLFTKLNSPQMAGPMAAEISKLIGLFETWLHLFGAVGGALFDLLKPAVGFGQQLAAGLTVLLDKTRQWLSAAGTQDVLHAVFQAHLDQLKGIFAMLTAAGPALGQAVILFLRFDVAVSETIAGVEKLVAAVIHLVSGIPFVSTVGGWALALLAAKKAFTGVLAAGNLLRVLFLGLGPAALLGAKGASGAVKTIGVTTAETTGIVAGLRGMLASMAGMIIPVTIAVSYIQSQKVPSTPGDQGFLAGFGAKAAHALHLDRLPGALGQFFNPNYASPGQQYGYTAPGLGANAPGGKLVPSPFPLGPGIHGQAIHKSSNPFAGIPRETAAQNFADRAYAQQQAALAAYKAYSVLGVPPVSSGGGGGGGATTGIGNAATTLGQLAGNYATLATTLNNAGVKAKQYLLDEQKALEKELAALPAASGKNAAAIKAAAATINNQLITVGVQIKDALDKTGAALIPKNLRTIMSSQTAQFTADSAYQQSLTGQVASDYGKVLMGDLTAQRVTLTDEIAKLKSQLNGATAKQKANINTEIAALQTQMTSLNNSIISQIESTINSLQSSLGTIFNSVQSELDTQLGNLYYQNGLLTPSEALLQSMQSADQLNGLNQSLAQAQTTLANDQSTLAKRVLDVSTGKITNVYDPKNAAQIAQDQQAVTQAQRALDEYNLQIKATQERTQADKSYMTQVAALNKQLAAWETAVMNGQTPIKSLSDIASSFGLTINQNLVPDFFGPDGLDTATKNLKQAFKDLIAYIGTLTGKTPQNSGGGGTNAGGSGIVVGPGGTLSYTGTGTPRAIPGHPIAMAGGGSGRVTRPTLFLVGEAGPEDWAASGANRSFGGGGGGASVHIHYDGPIVTNPSQAEEFAKHLVQPIRRELIRIGQRNGGSSKNLLGAT